MRHIKKLFIVVSLFFFLSGCSVFGPVESQPETTYIINVKNPSFIKKRLSHISLFVAPIESDPIYNTTQIAYSTNPYQIAYFAKNRWASTPGQMLQPLIVKTLQNTHHFHAVSSVSTMGQYDYILNTQLLELKQVFLPHSSQIHLRLRVQLVNTSTNRVLAVKEFYVIEGAAQRTPYGGVVATNRATAVFLNQLSRFCLEKL